MKPTVFNISGIFNLPKLFLEPSKLSSQFYFRTDIDRLIDQILLEEPLISASRKPHLKTLIESKQH
jgi:hypothetical protein